jgi:uncharacterized protein
LSAYNAYGNTFSKFAYWRLAGGIEVDFIVNDMQLAIEAKAAARVTADHLKGLRAVVQDHRITQRIVVCLERASRRTEDGIWIMPSNEFTNRLSSGDLF